MTVTTADLSGELILKDRKEIRDEYLRDLKVRVPAADTRPGTWPYVDASVLADTLVPVYANARTIADGTLYDSSTGARLEALCASDGVYRLAAGGASGYVQINASSGGTNILVGQELREERSGLRFKCSVSGTYQDGGQVPIEGVDTGPGTNIAAGRILNWTSPPPGCGTIAIVLESVDGLGLQGGRDIETDAELRERGKLARSQAAASGNDAEYQRRAERTPGVPVGKAFTYPAILGPGTVGVAVTLRPLLIGANRRPTNAQIVMVLGYLEGVFPHDDGIFVMTVLQQLVTTTFRVTWESTAAGWTDLSPWPTAASGAVVSVSTSPTSFSVTGSGVAPQVGQTVALYDQAAGAWRRKRILTVTGAGPWALTVDTSNNASDTVYVPVVGQCVSPWSDSLALLISPVLSYFDSLGPGEVYATFFDEGLRQKRSPGSPLYPNQIRNKLVEGVLDTTGVADATLLTPAVPSLTTVGTPGIAVYLQELGDLAVYAA